MALSAPMAIPKERKPGSSTGGLREIAMALGIAAVATLIIPRIANTPTQEKPALMEQQRKACAGCPSAFVCGKEKETKPDSVKKKELPGDSTLWSAEIKEIYGIVCMMVKNFNARPLNEEGLGVYYWRAVESDSTQYQAKVAAIRNKRDVRIPTPDDFSIIFNRSISINAVPTPNHLLSNWVIFYNLP